MKTGKNKGDVIFLLGAGASVEAGVRTSNEITDILINYGSHCPSEHSTTIENLVKYIQVRIADYLQVRTSEVNFELILGTLLELSKKEGYSIASFLGDEDILIKKLEKILSTQEVIDRLYALLRELFFVTNPVDYLDPLKSFMSFSKPLDLFTLNYDMSLETAFDKNGVSYTTGFVRRGNELPLWEPLQFSEKSIDARVFKLHGSINWGLHLLYPPPPIKSGATVDTALATDYYLTNYPQRVEFDPFPIGPVEPPYRKKGMVSFMNFGTRKELLYAESIFTILFGHFLESLNTSRICIICGYSFGDERINKILEEAVVSRQGKLQLVVVDPNVFRIEDETPVLRKFMEWEWSTPLEVKIGDALKDGSLFEIVKEMLQQNTIPKQIGQIVPTYQGGEGEKPDAEEILYQWRILGISFDLTYFWMRSVWPHLKELEKSNDESEIAKIGQVLLPLNRKVRDLCFHIRSLYEAMYLRSGAYGGEYLETIKVNPKLTKDYSHKDLIQKWLPRLPSAVGAAFHGYNLRSAEFRRAIADLSYGKEMDAPSNISAAELVVGHDINRTYEIVCILNDIYKGAGYEEPFKMINEHFCKDAR
jgi:hypothetical protein